MARIHINANGPDSAGGYFSYIVNLLNEISIIDRKNDYTIWANGQIYESLRSLDHNFKVIRSRKFLNFSFFRFLWMQFYLPFLLLIKRSDILFSPLNASPFILKILNIRSIMVLHSNLPWTNPKYLPYGYIKAKLLKVFKNQSLKCSDTIICVSRFAMKEIIKKTNIAREKFTYVHLGTNFLSKNRKVKKENFFLYVANSAAHHNHLVLLEAFKVTLDKTNNEYILQLVIDPIDRKNFLRIKQRIDRLGLKKSVKMLHPLNKFQLMEKYSSALLYLFPSLSETFGMTTLEAMSQGTPVLCSNISSMPEINGQAAHYFDPKNAIDISDKLLEVLNNRKLYNKLVRRGYERTKIFNWHETAQRTLKIINNMK